MLTMRAIQLRQTLYSTASSAAAMSMCYTYMLPDSTQTMCSFIRNGSVHTHPDVLCTPASDRNGREKQKLHAHCSSPSIAAPLLQPLLQWPHPHSTPDQYPSSFLPSCWKLKLNQTTQRSECPPGEKWNRLPAKLEFTLFFVCREQQRFQNKMKYRFLEYSWRKNENLRWHKMPAAGFHFPRHCNTEDFVRRKLPFRKRSSGFV